MTKQRSPLRLLSLALLATFACAGPPEGTVASASVGRRNEPTPVPEEPPQVRSYVAGRMIRAPRIDGRLETGEWGDAAWTEPFQDIEGQRLPAPPFDTRVLMAWDDEHLYIGASLEEPDLQASLTERDAIIYQDNDFEVFLDPDGDTHDYFELEINALGTEMDLRLPKPYRDGGKAELGWDFTGLRTAVSLEGTLNDPSDRDGGWSVEIAIPFAALGLAAPGDGEQWRVNFSRVEWKFAGDEGVYRKELDPATGRPLPESNWVWSPQYAVNMHMPELWGIVQFSDGGENPGTEFSPPADRLARWSLRRVYYAQQTHHREHDAWADDLGALGLEGLADGLQLVQSGDSSAGSEIGWLATVPGTNGHVWRIRADGRVWKERE